MAGQGITGCFYGLPIATLNTQLTYWLNVLTGISTAGQSYTLGGRTFNRANLGEVRQTIQELQAAINRANGTSLTQTFANMNTGTSGGAGGSNWQPNNYS